MPQTDCTLNKNSEIPLAEVAKMLGIAYQTAWRWAKAGRFGDLNQTVAGRIHVSRDAVFAMLAGATRPLGRGANRGD